MTDPESKIRAVIGLLRQRYRVLPVQAYDDEAVEGIRAVLAAAPSGAVTADGPEAARAVAALKERAERAEATAREMLDGFEQRGNGYSQRVSTATYEGWRQRQRPGEPE